MLCACYVLCRAWSVPGRALYVLSTFVWGSKCAVLGVLGMLCRMLSMPRCAEDAERAVLSVPCCVC